MFEQVINGGESGSHCLFPLCKIGINRSVELGPSCSVCTSVCVCVYVCTYVCMNERIMVSACVLLLKKQSYFNFLSSIQLTSGVI